MPYHSRVWHGILGTSQGSAAHDRGFDFRSTRSNESLSAGDISAAVGSDRWVDKPLDRLCVEAAVGRFAGILP
jgi:hypothetical protein